MIAIAIWFLLIGTTLASLAGTPRPVTEWLSKDWVIDPRLIALLTLSLATIGTWKLRGIRPHLLYITFYPAIVLGAKIPRLLSKNWALTLAFLPAIYEAVITFRLTATIYIAVGTSLAVISRSSNPGLIAVAMAVLGAALAGHLWQAFQHAYRATMFSSLTQLVRRLKTSIESGKIGETFFAPATKQEQPSATNSRLAVANDGSFEVLYLTNCAFDIAAAKVTQAGKSKRIDLYLLSRWFWTLALISIVFPFENWGAYKLSPASFQGVVHGSFAEFLLYSLTFLPGSRASAVDPHSALAVAIYIAELLSYGFAFVVLLPFTILMVSRQNYQDEIKDFAEELRSTATAVLDRAELAFRLTFDQIELAIAGKNAAMVNWLRQARGMSVLIGPPAAPEVNPKSGVVVEEPVSAPRRPIRKPPKAKKEKKSRKK